MVEDGIKNKIEKIIAHFRSKIFFIKSFPLSLEFLKVAQVQRCP
jgi:hypothetical protein